jgi:hypothetical protein
LPASLVLDEQLAVMSLVGPVQLFRITFKENASGKPVQTRYGVGIHFYGIHGNLHMIPAVKVVETFPVSLELRIKKVIGQAYFTA